MLHFDLLWVFFGYGLKITFILCSWLYKNEKKEREREKRNFIIWCHFFLLWSTFRTHFMMKTDTLVICFLKFKCRFCTEKLDHFSQKESRPAINKQSQDPFLKILLECWTQSDTWKSKYTRTLKTMFLRLINSILIFQRNLHANWIEIKLKVFCCGWSAVAGSFLGDSLRYRLAMQGFAVSLRYSKTYYILYFCSIALWIVLDAESVS